MNPFIYLDVPCYFKVALQYCWDVIVFLKLALN